MKYKRFYFDIEIIIDHEIPVCGKIQKVSSHHTMRGFNLQELIDTIKLNRVPDDETTKITFNVRGVNY